MFTRLKNKDQKFELLTKRLIFGQNTRDPDEESLEAQPKGPKPETDDSGAVVKPGEKRTQDKKKGPEAQKKPGQDASPDKRDKKAVGKKEKPQEGKGAGKRTSFGAIEKEHLKRLKEKGEVGIEFAKSFEDGYLTPHAFEQGYIRVFESGAYQGRDADHYKQLFRLANKNRFRRSSEFLGRIFLELVDGLREEEGPVRDKCIELIDRIDRGGTLDKDDEDPLIDEIEAAKPEDVRLLNRLTGSKAVTGIERATINSDIAEKIGLQGAERSESNEDRKFRNYTPEQYPEGTDEKMYELRALMEQSNEADELLNEFQEEYDELTHAVGHRDPDDRERKIELRGLMREQIKKVKDLDRTIRPLEQEIRIRTEDIDAREDAAEKILLEKSREIGCADIRKVERLRTSSGDYITNIRIERDRDENVLSKDPGVFNISYDLRGKRWGEDEDKISLVKFASVIAVREEITDEGMRIEDLQNLLGYQGEIKEGDRFFSTKETTDPETGRNTYQKNEFRITSIYEKDGVQYVTMNNPDREDGKVEIESGRKHSNLAPELRQKEVIGLADVSKFSRAVMAGENYVRIPEGVVLPAQNEVARGGQRVWDRSSGVRRTLDSIFVGETDPFGRSTVTAMPAGFKRPENFEEFQRQFGPRISEIERSERAFFEDVNKGDIVNYQPEGYAEGAHGKEHSGVVDHTQGAGQAGGQAAGHGDHGGAPKAERMPATALYRDTLEALPIDRVNKVDQGEIPQTGYLRKLWSQTRVLSVMDVWEMLKVGKEYYDRRFKRNQQAKFSDVAKNVTFFSSEMQRISQQAENEQVHQYKESMEQMGIWDVEKRMHDPANKDELKACLETLSSKGELRWDDIELWNAINKFVDPAYYIPIPSNHDPATIVDEKTGRTGFGYLEMALNSIWGAGTYAEFYAHNKSTTKSKVHEFYEKGKELECTTDGPGARLKELLWMWKHDEYVNPHEYEGLIQFSIEYGKATGDEKFYYIIAGIAAKNSEGKTILGFDRASHINSEQLSRFPILEWMTAHSPERAPTGEGKAFTKDDYEQWLKHFDGDNPMNCEPNQRVVDFMWNFVIPSREHTNRVNKDVRNADNLDHDDMQMILPVASTQVVDNVCRSVGGGGKELLTKEGYKNAYIGYSNFMRTLAKNDRRDLLEQTIMGYFRFDNIMNSRYKRGNDGYARLDSKLMGRRCIVTKFSPQQISSLINPMIFQILEAYAPSASAQDQKDIYRLIELTGQSQDEWSDKSVEQQRREGEETTHLVDKFDTIFSRLVKSDGGDKMVNIIKSTELLDISYTTKASREKQKEQMEKLTDAGQTTRLY